MSACTLAIYSIHLDITFILQLCILQGIIALLTMITGYTKCCISNTPFVSIFGCSYRQKEIESAFEF